MIQQLYRLPVPPLGQVDMASFRPVCYDQPPNFRAALRQGKSFGGLLMLKCANHSIATVYVVSQERRWSGRA